MSDETLFGLLPRVARESIYHEHFQRDPGLAWYKNVPECSMVKRTYYSTHDGLHRWLVWVQWGGRWSPLSFGQGGRGQHQHVHAATLFCRPVAWSSWWQRNCADWFWLPLEIHDLSKRSISNWQIAFRLYAKNSCGSSRDWHVVGTIMLSTLRLEPSCTRSASERGLRWSDLESKQKSLTTPGNYANASKVSTGVAVALCPAGIFTRMKKKCGASGQGATHHMEWFWVFQRFQTFTQDFKHNDHKTGKDHDRSWKFKHDENHGFSKPRVLMQNPGFSLRPYDFIGFWFHWYIYLFITLLKQPKISQYIYTVIYKQYHSKFTSNNVILVSLKHIFEYMRYHYPGKMHDIYIYT